MHSNEDPLIQALIAKKLGLADAEDEARVREAGPQAGELLDQLDAVLAPLDSWSAPAPPPDLNQRIMSRIESVDKTISFEEAAAAMRPEVPARPRSGWNISIRDLVAAAACITLLVGLFMPGYRNARSVMERNACQANMRQLYAGMAGFAEDHQNRLPYAAAPGEANWLAPRQASGRPGANTRHMFVLLKEGYVPHPQVFICPARPDDVPMNPCDYTQLVNFPRRCNVSYSLQNMAGQYSVTMEVDPNMAVLGDANPLFDYSAVRSILGENLNQLNSYAHGRGAGQNVLYLSGRVIFAKAPTVGVAGDNIWQAGNLTDYTGAEVPQYLTDSFLVP
ncbi:MAG: hypothetical protein JSU68_12595 [Phycisphaerales bacterium]|nr:MAG: hypothetical protein JSU68_12595 [Phycisphaerales bacterium]